jgi:hypothetical protein
MIAVEEQLDTERKGVRGIRLDDQFGYVVSRIATLKAYASGLVVAATLITPSG